MAIYKEGISSPKGFNMTAAEPVDQREIVAYHSDLLSLPNVYLGIEVKVKDLGYKKYRLIAFPSNVVANWIELNIKGDTGAQGTGVDKNFTFTQALPASTWTVKHDLNKYPSVTVMDSANTIVDGMIVYQDLNTITITFNGGFSGTAIIN